MRAKFGLKLRKDWNIVGSSASLASWHRGTWTPSDWNDHSNLHESGVEAANAGHTLLSIPGKVYAMAVEKRFRAELEENLGESQFGFQTGRGAIDQLLTLKLIIEGSSPDRSLLASLIWRRYTMGVSLGKLWDVLGIYGLDDSQMVAVSFLYEDCRSCIRITGQMKETFGWPLDATMGTYCRYSHVHDTYGLDAATRSQWIDKPKYSLQSIMEDRSN